jgi:hypothetical protein
MAKVLGKNEGESANKEVIQYAEIHGGHHRKQDDQQGVNGGLSLCWPTDMLELTTGVTKVVYETVHDSQVIGSSPWVSLLKNRPAGLLLPYTTGVIMVRQGQCAWVTDI